VARRIRAKFAGALILDAAFTPMPFTHRHAWQLPWGATRKPAPVRTANASAEPGKATEPRITFRHGLFTGRVENRTVRDLLGAAHNTKVASIDFPDVAKRRARFMRLGLDRTSIIDPARPTGRQSRRKR